MLIIETDVDKCGYRTGLVRLTFSALTFISIILVSAVGGAAIATLSTAISSSSGPFSIDAPIVYGVNDDVLDDSDSIISAASCTTNAIVPILKVLNDKYGIDGGHVETVHSTFLTINVLPTQLFLTLSNT